MSGEHISQANLGNTNSRFIDTKPMNARISLVHITKNNIISDIAYHLQVPIYSSFGTVLIFQFSPGFGTEASVPAVSRYRFLYLNSVSYFSLPGFRYKVFRELFVFVSFRYRCGSISAPNQVEPKVLVLEPNMTGT